MHKLTVLLGLVWFVATLSVLAADKPRETRCYELRTYYAAPDKLEALNARFRTHTTRIFEKHGMDNIGYWTPAENPDDKLVYLLESGQGVRGQRQTGDQGRIGLPERD